MNKVYIIGGGTIGRALAVILQRHRRDVLLVRASKEASAATERIGVFLNDGMEIAEQVAVSSLNDIKAFDGVIVLTTKSYGNEGVAAALAGKTGGAPIVILQNGLGVEDPFLQGGFSPLYRCVLFATSQYKDGGNVTFKPVTASPIGVVAGGDGSLEEVVGTLDTPVFPFAVTEDIRKIVWTKTIANCVFNSVCPLLETDNGIFHRNEEALSLAKTMIAECVAVAALEAIQLSVGEVTERLLLISQSSDGQFISTLQDIRNRRPTEIETLNFAIARAAAEKGREELAPVTRSLGELIKLKSLLSLQ